METSSSSVEITPTEEANKKKGWNLLGSNLHRILRKLQAYTPQIDPIFQVKFVTPFLCKEVKLLASSKFLSTKKVTLACNQDVTWRESWLGTVQVSSRLISQNKKSDAPF